MTNNKTYITSKYTVAISGLESLQCILETAVASPVLG